VSSLRAPSVCGLALVAALALSPGAAADAGSAADRAAMLDGVASVDLPGAPGAICVFGDDAFAVLTGDPKRPEAVVAAARSAKGRVVAFAHNGYLAPKRLGAKDGAGRLLVNALRWAAGRDRGAKVAVLGGDEAWTGALASAGFEVVPRPEFPRTRPDVLVVADPDRAFEAQAAEIEEYVRGGGGLVAGVCPWGWEQVHGGRTLRRDFPLNRFLARCGLAFADGTPDATGGGTYVVARSRPDAVHAGEALRRVESRDPDAAAAVHLVEKALRSVPPEDTLFLPRAAKAAARVPATDFPRPSRPLSPKDGLARLAVAWRTIAWRDLAPEDVRAAPGADEFPGAPPARAERVTARLVLDPDPPGWRSTGLYLAPGEVLTVATAPATGGRRSPVRWRVRIGCHTDTLWHLDEWRRWPEITHTAPLGDGVTRVATPWGGLVYFEPGEGAERLDVSVAGAVESPVHDPRARRPEDADRGRAAWTSRRAAPGPWAEIVGDHLVLTVPSAAVRQLDDPDALRSWWDSVVAAHCNLGSEPVPTRPERFVADVQISAGYMHSGYPIMMHLDVATPRDGRPASLLDLDQLRRAGSWGPFHELGHNRQRPEWTFEGTGEVTCNLFSLHAGETLCGVPAWSNPWLEGQKANAARYLQAPDFAKWRSDPGVALVSYAQVARQFGWEPFRRTFAAYRELPEAARPRSEAQKIDTFVTRLSLACGRDLRPFFRRWAWPLSETVTRDAALGALEPWEPEWSDVRPGGR
jgi:hypothetical protein